jgi:hypothetical protein
MLNITSDKSFSAGIIIFPSILMCMKNETVSQMQSRIANPKHVLYCIAHCYPPLQPFFLEAAFYFRSLLLFYHKRLVKNIIGNY